MTDTYLVAMKAPFPVEAAYVTNADGFPVPVYETDGVTPKANPFTWSEGGKQAYWQVEAGSYNVVFKGADGKRHEDKIEVLALDSYLKELKYLDDKPFFVRTIGNSDEYTISEHSYRALKIDEGAVVMDLGGHIGTFARRALAAGASKVVSYEAEPNNARVLAKNLAGFNAEAIHSAMTSNHPDAITLFVNTGICSTIHSLTPTRGRVPVQVPTVDFQTELEKYRPSIIKSDMEGSEYGLDWNLPDYVKKVAMEVHTKPVAQFFDKALAIVETINAQGFKLVKDIKLEPKARMPIAVWERS